MGLDQYSYTKCPVTKEVVDNDFAYWRKHNALHGWMEKLWIEKGRPNQDPVYPDFNNVALQLTYADLCRLQEDINNDSLEEIHGFFFGADSRYDVNKIKSTQEFIEKARKAIAIEFLEVYYDSSW